MSSPLISETTRRRLAESLAAIQSHKPALIERLADNLAAAEVPDEPFGQAEAAASMLGEMLVDAARRLVERAPPAALHAAAAEHRSTAIDGRHYSRFGDALTPVLRDVLGPNLPREITAAWCDTFWALVRAMQQQPDARELALEDQ